MATRNDIEMPLTGRQAQNEEEYTRHRSSVGTVLRYQVQVCDVRNSRDSHFVLCRQRILVCSRSRCLKPAVLSTPPPTMNYGWLRDNTPNDEYSRVVLHEFGHALGCVHEHQSPKFTRKWNTAAVMKYFKGPPNYWSPDDIRHSVLEKYSPRGVSATRFDPKSIMLYPLDGAL